MTAFLVVPSLSATCRRDMPRLTACFMYLSESADQVLFPLKFDRLPLSLGMPSWQRAAATYDRVRPMVSAISLLLKPLSIMSLIC